MEYSSASLTFHLFSGCGWIYTLKECVTIYYCYYCGLLDFFHHWFNSGYITGHFFRSRQAAHKWATLFTVCVWDLNYPIKMSTQHYMERSVRANFPTLLWFCLCYDDVNPPPFIYTFHRNGVFLLNALCNSYTRHTFPFLDSSCTSHNFFSSCARWIWMVGGFEA